MVIESNNQQLLKQAYTHPKFSDQLFLGTPTICPRCQCELSMVIREEQGRKFLLCQHCGLQYQEKDIAA